MAVPDWVNTALPHFVLLLTLLTYIVCGSVIIYVLELNNCNDPAQLQASEDAEKLRQLYLNLNNKLQEPNSEIDGGVFGTDGSIADAPAKQLEDYRELIERAIARTHSSRTFRESFLFAVTAVSAVGYSHGSPSSTAAKIFSLIYTVVGFPLFSVVITHIAKSLTDFLIDKFDSGGVCVRVSKGSKAGKNGPEQKIDEGEAEADEWHCPSEPKKAILALWLACVVICTTIFGLVSSGGFLASLYTCVNAILSVGIFDIQQPSWMIVILLVPCIVIGSALTSTVNDVVGLEYIRFMRKVVRLVEDRFRGLVGGEDAHEEKTE